MAAAKGDTATAPKRNSIVDETLIIDSVKQYGKLSAALLAAWLVGFVQFSFLWVVVALAIYVWKQREAKVTRNRAKISRGIAVDEKSAILARLDELPSWVHFPDVERAEWVNKVVHQLWPYIGDFLENILREQVEPLIRGKLPAPLKSFKFSTIDLGHMSPRVNGVKVYTEMKRDEIYIDVELDFNSECDLVVSLSPFSAGLKDFRLHGTLRVVLKPLISRSPLIGALRIFFLKDPDFDFTLTSLASALDLPGLSNLLRAIIKEQIAQNLVLPNCVPVRLVKGLDLYTLKYPLPQAVVRVKVVEAKFLMEADFSLTGSGSSDPYVRLKLGPREVRTRVIKSALDPTWNETFDLVLDSAHGQRLELDILDDDQGTKDDELGRVSMDLSPLKAKGFMDEWLPLEDVKQGMIHIQLTWLWLANDPLELDRVLEMRALRRSATAAASMMALKQANNDIGQDTAQEENWTYAAILFVYLDSAENLPLIKKSLQQPSPKATLTVGQQTMESKVKDNTCDPRWEEHFRFMLHNPVFQQLAVELQDSSSDNTMGEVHISLREILEADDLTMDRKFHIDTSEAESHINLRLVLRILTDRPDPRWLDTLDKSLTKGLPKDKVGLPPDTSTVTKEKLGGEPEPRVGRDVAPPMEDETNHDRIEKDDKIQQQSDDKGDEKAKPGVTKIGSGLDQDLGVERNQETTTKKQSISVEEATTEAGDRVTDKVTGESKAPNSRVRVSTQVLKTKSGLSVEGEKGKPEGGELITPDLGVSAKVFETSPGLRVEGEKGMPEGGGELDREIRKEAPTLLPCADFNAEKDCEAIEKAIHFLGVEEETITAIFSKRSQEQREIIAATFNAIHHKELSKELSSKLWGNIKNLMEDMLLGPAQLDAKYLNSAIKGLGTDEKVLVEILCTRSSHQLSQIKAAYRTMFARDLETDLANDTSGDFQRLLLGCLGSERPEGAEFDPLKARENAQTLLAESTTKDAWTSSESLLHKILVSQSYAQLRATLREFARIAGCQLEERIEANLSGDMKDGLLAITQVVRHKESYFAKTLHTAVSGFGTDTDTLGRIVLTRCEVDMEQIKEEFQREFQKGLGEFIAADTSGHYSAMLLGLLGEQNSAP